MSKFRFYITDLFHGRVVGTDDEKNASDHAVCEDFFVVDTETGQWLTGEGREEVQEVGHDL